MPALRWLDPRPTAGMQPTIIVESLLLLSLASSLHGPEDEGME